ncbi:MAG: hypothetical protein E7645_00805 [Ruminococcaceae bacterium]|nr:hypothetical protein [Oscillospiraceae bacterium]
MKKMFRTLLLMGLCFCLLGGSMLTALPVLAEDTPVFDTSDPLVLYDFSTSEIGLSINNPYNFTYEFSDEGYMSITALGDDPSMHLPVPEVRCNQMAYAVIFQRTTSTRQGEFYVNRSDGKQMGQDGTNVKFDQNSSGEWAKSIADCSVWTNVDDSVTFTGFRYDPLQLNVPEGEHIDVKYVAFFETLEDAKRFDFDTYKEKLAYEEKEENKENETVAPEVEWPAPEYKDMETVPEDTAEGTLTYTVSEDEKTVTISYKVNDETRTFTVPNTNQYKSGTMTAVDDLGRSLYNASQVGVIGDNGEHYVGMFYFLWHGEHGDPGIFDLEKIRQTGGSAAMNANSGLYGPMHSFHWFAEPLYGYYYINDEWVIRKHMELLTNVGVDFLYFDVTNNSIYAKNAIKIMEILHELNEQGYDAPEVVFYTNTNAQQRVKELYDYIYSQNLYPDTWFMLNGKPVVISPDNINYKDFFTVKASQWPNDETIHENAWPWMDFQWPQRVFNDEKGNPSAISVSVAQHSGTIMFSDSSLYGEYTNRGRSFHNPDGHSDKRVGIFNRLLKTSYEAWAADNSLTNQGYNFQAQWDYAIEKDVPFVLVTGWNEWIAQRQDGNTYIEDKDPDRVLFVDTASAEFSRDIEMMRGGYFDNYYVQLAYNIQKLKGTAPIVVQDGRKPINVTGEFDQWNDISVSYADPTGDAAHRDATGFGQTHYVNQTGRNDIVASKITNDTQNLYVYAQTAHDISMFDPNSAWMQLYINTDGNHETGWYGYDFIINHKAKDTFTTTVAKYNGTDGAYGFETVGEVSYRAKDNELMIAVPLTLLGVTDYRQIAIDFKWVDSTSVINTMEQFYTDGDCMPLGRMNYVYQTYIPGESVFEALPGDETTEESTPITEESSQVETSDTSAASDPQKEPQGCASAISLILPMMLILTSSAWIFKKKEN